MLYTSAAFILSGSNYWISHNQYALVVVQVVRFTDFKLCGVVKSVINKLPFRNANVDASGLQDLDYAHNN